MSQPPNPRPRNLPGQANPHEFRSTNELGVAVDPHRAIVPVLRQAPNGDFDLVGTAFFIAQNGIIATARHVARSFQDHPDNAMGILQLVDETSYIIRSLETGIEHNFADVAVVFTTPATHNVTKAPLMNLVCQLTTRIPKIGSRIFTFAYPKTTVLHGKPQRMSVAPAFYDGRIVDYLPDGRDSVMVPGPCYQTSMIIHGGASGGPVFDEDGCVFAINSTGWGTEPLSFVSSITH
jgi:hypothetical protein